jgi:hypothetical protein
MEVVKLPQNVDKGAFAERIGNTCPVSNSGVLFLKYFDPFFTQTELTSN